MAEPYEYPAVDPDQTVWECAGVRRLLAPGKCFICDAYRTRPDDGERYPGHDGYTDCRYRDHRYGHLDRVGSIASGGTVSHCSCYVCFAPYGRTVAAKPRSTSEAQR